MEGWCWGEGKGCCQDKSGAGEEEGERLFTPFSGKVQKIYFFEIPSGKSKKKQETFNWLNWFRFSIL